MREHNGVAIAVAGIVTTVLTMLAWLLVVLVWTSLTVYALVKWIGSAPDAASPTTVLLIVVGLVTALALLLTLPITLVGRSMTPRRRTKRAGLGEPPRAEPPVTTAEPAADALPTP